MIQSLNPWSTKDEQEHYPSVLEWWCTEGFISDSKKNNRWSFKGSFTEWCTKEKHHGSTYDFTIFDLNKNNHLSRYKRDDTKKLDIKKDKKGALLISYDNSFLTGRYPSYSMRYENDKKDLLLELTYQAEAYPHWITQDITGGYLPMGFGFYRYGFIPRNTIKGTMTLQDETYNVDGTGYYEHVWGDFSYKNPLSNLSYLKKSLSIYQKLIGWWIHHHQLKIPDTIRFLSENNPLGYDWVWGILDNGWSFLLGNILFWVAEGPIFGTLILTKDGEEYTEFCDVSYKYSSIKHSDHHDFVYPTGIDITARNGKETLSLHCEMTMKPREFITPLHQKRWIAFVICEAPGKVNGMYVKDVKKIALTGDCKIEPQRQVSKNGHNEICFEFVKPPKGLGITITMDSHYLKKHLKSSVVFTPFPHVSMKIKKRKP